MSNHDLRFHDIYASDFFGDRVFDLNAWINLDEVELVRVGVNEKLNRAGILVADLFANRDGGITESLSDLRKQIGRRGNLNHFLVSTLDRAIALKEVN